MPTQEEESAVPSERCAGSSEERTFNCLTGIIILLYCSVAEMLRAAPSPKRNGSISLELKLPQNTPRLRSSDKTHARVTVAVCRSPAAHVIHHFFKYALTKHSLYYKTHASGRVSLMWKVHQVSLSQFTKQNHRVHAREKKPHMS